ncbi:MAG: DUF167 domain-containing protein [Nanoarchaeota archaeon]|nr:DUF167 domain-containing protein [Nanoarchaeota archaeon]
MKIKVKVKPNSDCNCLIKVVDGEYSAQVKEPAESCKANTALIRLLCREFKVNFKKIKIKNPTSRHKVIEID